MVNPISEISGFFKKSIEKRQEIISSLFSLNKDEVNLLKNFGYFTKTQIDSSIENVIGSYQLPLAIATNFKINDCDYLVPMVIEEPSIVAAASNAAKIARKLGGFYSNPITPHMISQIQITNIPNIKKAIKKIKEHEQEILDLANKQDPILIELGGGAIEVSSRVIETKRNPMLIVHLIVNVLDAMGANIVNSMSEAISEFLERLTGGKSCLRIVSNLATQRIAFSKATFDKDSLGGAEIVDRIMDAYEFALADPYRATTHNKGIMNGIIAVVLATGNDTRAIEAGAHSFACINGTYQPLTKFDKDDEGNLVGSIELPLAMGIVGGITKNHPMAKLALKIIGVKSAEELCQVVAAVGLAQNVAALRALASEGIQRGHMKLHSRNIAKLAGVPDKYIEEVAKRMVNEGSVRVDKAEEFYRQIRNK